MRYTYVHIITTTDDVKIVKQNIVHNFTNKSKNVDVIVSNIKPTRKYQPIKISRYNTSAKKKKNVLLSASHIILMSFTDSSALTINI